MASIAPVTDSIRSFVFFAGGTGGGCGLGGGGLDGGFPFLDGGVDASCCGGLTIVSGCFSIVVGMVIVVVVVLVVPNRSTFVLSDVAKILDDWLVKTLVAGVSISVVVPNPASGTLLSMPKEANGLVELTDTGGSYVSSLPKLRKIFSPAPELVVSAKS